MLERSPSMLFKTIKYILILFFLSVSFIVYVGACGKEIFEDMNQNEVAESLEEESSQRKTEATF